MCENGTEIAEDTQERAVWSTQVLIRPFIFRIYCSERKYIWLQNGRWAWTQDFKIKFLYKSRYFRNKDMKIFSSVTFSWFMILNIYHKNNWHTDKGRDFFVYQNDRPNFSSFLHQAIKELTTWEWYAVSDMNHSSHQQVFYGSLWPTFNTDQSATECSVDKITYYMLSITKQVTDTMYSIPQI